MQVAGARRTVRPMPGLRLKVNLLLLAIQVPALVILAYSTTRGIHEMVQDMGRAQADRLGRELNRRLADRLSRFAAAAADLKAEAYQEAKVKALQEEVQAFMESAGAHSASVFLAEENQLVRQAHFGDSAPKKPDEDDLLALEGRTVARSLEPPWSTLAVVHRPFRNTENLLEGVIVVQVDQRDNLLQVQSYNRQLIVGMVVIFALTALVLFGGMHLLVVSPVKKLVAAMGRAREGRLEPVAVDPAQDEIGWLARTYNEMVLRLRAVLEEKEGLLAEVRDLNVNLQKRIDEATRDLAKSHFDLQRAYHDLYASQREHERLQGLASLGQVGREIAHEFATPLNVISGTLQMLLEDSGLRPEHRDRLSRVLAQTERLIQITRDTLTPLKMPAPELRPADLNTVVEEMGAFMAPAFAARGVEFRTKLPPRLPPVRVDLHQIEQVLMNLISNALDALPAGGRIEVETKSIPGDTPTVSLIVRDDGVGIPPDYLPHIFDPFFTTKGAGRGSGLGLSICKDILAQHHGQISIESTPGHGSCVTVRLPAALPVGEVAV